MVSFGFILVVNAPQNMVADGADTFSVRFRPVLTAVALALVILPVANCCAGWATCEEGAQ